MKTLLTEEDRSLKISVNVMVRKGLDASHVKGSAHPCTQTVNSIKLPPGKIVGVDLGSLRTIVSIFYLFLQFYISFYSFRV